MNRETVLPKNIRQIGEKQQDKKVYLEDYVITFIRRKEKERRERTAPVYCWARFSRRERIASCLSEGRLCWMIRRRTLKSDGS